MTSASLHTIRQQIQSRQPRWVLALLAVVLSVVMMQDYLRTLINGTSYFWHESMLFASFWALFLPGMLVLWRACEHPPLNTFPVHKRYPLLLVVVLIVHYLCAAFLIWSLSSLFFDHRYEFTGVLTYLVGDYLYLAMLIYSGILLLAKLSIHTTVHLPAAEPVGEFTNRILVNHGRSNTIVDTSAIFYISAATPYVAIHLQGRKLLHNETMKAIEGQLDTSLFVRVHRSCIVNIGKIVSWKSRLNGDYDLELQNGETVRLSRNYWPAFKSKLGKGPQPGV